jgi:hypothetical protein
VSGAPDALRQSLGVWWREQELPPVERLSDQQGRRVLDQIEAMHWDCRPFHPDEA